MFAVWKDENIVCFQLNWVREGEMQPDGCNLKLAPLFPTPGL